jgi:DNA-binding winged helix-turn-helix (wHTH) protein/Tol biopolymer transport system component
MADIAETLIFRFEDFEFDSSRGILCRRGAALKLQPQPFRALQILLERAPRIVTRDEIARHIWGNEVHVDLEQSINFCIRQIRSALDDSASNPRFIETLPKQGYRFIHEVIQDGSAQIETSAAEISVVSAPLSVAGARGWHAHLDRRNFMLLGGAAALGVTGLSLGLWLNRRSRESAVNVVLSLPAGAAAADPGHILGPPVVAPDGSAVIVSLATSDGNFLYIRRLDTDRLVRMEGTHDGTQPFWSPDSLQVGFFADAKLKRMTIAGGSAITLCDAPGPRRGAWGRGKIILFGLNYHGLYKVSENGGEAAQATRLDTSLGENSHRNPVFLPDGFRFLYFARTNDAEKRAIYMDSLEATIGRKRIGVVDSNFTLALDPEENTWYLLSEQAGRTMMQAFDMRQGALSGTPRLLLNKAGTISVSDTGALVIRTDPETLTRLVWSDRSGSEMGKVGETGDYWSVAISPDDKSLLTLRHDGLTGQFNVWTSSGDRGLLEPLANSEALTAHWSGDSSTIYYTNLRRHALLSRKLSLQKPADILMNLSGDRTVLVEDISFDGRYVIAQLITHGAVSEIAWSEIKQSPVWHSIGASGPVGLRAKLSPDGRWLAFDSNETGRSEVYVTDFPGTSFRQRISTDGGRTARWRRDAKELFYVANDETLMSVPLTLGSVLKATPPQKLFRANFRGGSDGPLYDVSGDGQRFLHIDAEGTPEQGEIRLVLHWPSLVTQTTV